MQVGVRELKARLSEFLNRAVGGEEVVVTDRGRPIVRLVPLSGGSSIERGHPGRMGHPALSASTRRSPAAPGTWSCARRARRRPEVTLYVDSSALLKRYVAERDSSVAIELMTSDPVLATGLMTEVEVRRNLARLLDGEALTGAREDFTRDLDAFALVAIDATTCNEAARIAEQTLCRSAGCPSSRVRDPGWGIDDGVDLRRASGTGCPLDRTIGHRRLTARRRFGQLRERTPRAFATIESIVYWPTDVGDLHEFGLGELGRGVRCTCRRRGRIQR